MSHSQLLVTNGRSSEMLFSLFFFYFHFSSYWFVWNTYNMIGWKALIPDYWFGISVTARNTNNQSVAEWSFTLHTPRRCLLCFILPAVVFSASALSDPRVSLIISLSCQWLAFTSQSKTFCHETIVCSDFYISIHVIDHLTFDDKLEKKFTLFTVFLPLFLPSS